MLYKSMEKESKAFRWASAARQIIKTLQSTEVCKESINLMCITKWRTASLKTMNNVLDFDNRYISKGP